MCVCIRLIRHLWLVTLWSEYFYFIAYHRQRKRWVNLPVCKHTHINIHIPIHISTRRTWQRWLVGWPCNIITAFGFVGSEVDVTKFSVVWPIRVWILFYIIPDERRVCRHYRPRRTIPWRRQSRDIIHVMTEQNHGQRIFYIIRVLAYYIIIL